MAAVEVKDFLDIYSYVLEQLKIPATDTTTLARVKRDINAIYVNEVAPYKRWPWLKKTTDVVHPKYHDAGGSTTASVTEDSTAVTLSANVDESTSYLGYYFQAADGVIYTISAHTLGNDTLTLSVPYQGDTNATSSYKIWTDKVDLPTDAREVLSMRHDNRGYEIKPAGSQKFDEIAQRDRLREGYPEYYSTDDYYDPSTGDAETESDRYKQVRIYPAVYNKDQVVHVDYVQEVTSLDADGDEPVMPIEDRMVLVYGALARSWVRDRNPETYALNEELFRSKLAQMAGRVGDNLDRPRIEIDAQYMRLKRKNWRGSGGY